MLLDCPNCGHFLALRPSTNPYDAPFICHVCHRGWMRLELTAENRAAWDHEVQSHDLIHLERLLEERAKEIEELLPLGRNFHHHEASLMDASALAFVAAHPGFGSEIKAIVNQLLGAASTTTTTTISGLLGGKV